MFRRNSVIPDTEYGTIYYYIAQEFTAIPIATHGSNIFTSPFSKVCLRVLHYMSGVNTLSSGRQSNLIDHRRAIVSQVIGFRHTFFNVQVANIDCKIQNNSPNKLDSSKKMEKFIPIVELLGVGGAIYWLYRRKSAPFRHHNFIT